MTALKVVTPSRSPKLNQAAMEAVKKALHVPGPGRPRSSVMGLILLFWIASLIFAQVPAEAKTILKDMVGRRVEIPENVTTIVTTIVTTFKPATIMAYCLGLEQKICGMDNSSRKSPLLQAIYPGTRKIIGVGQKATGINMETLVGLAPDLVILFSQKNGRVLADRLNTLGIPAIVIVPETFDSIKTAMDIMGKATGTYDKSRAAAQEMDKILGITDQRIARLDPLMKKTGYFASPMGFYSTATGAMLQHKIFKRASIINVAGGLEGYFQRISPEQLVRWNPNIIVLSSHMAETELKGLNMPPPPWTGSQPCLQGRFSDAPLPWHPGTFPLPSLCWPPSGWPKRHIQNNLSA
ncbi:MAG: ABC transporter substrate-binding protein [Desulfobacter sp.]|nr:MAG: ABC transporter substrate-binding protein [Desulfobacter sp.]